jgi:uncharacterized protein YggT (Ycf19 family)
MSLIDLILNIACLLLWVSWRSVPFDPFTRTTPATLAGTVRRAEPLRVRPWHFLVALAGVLLVRAVFYWWIGGALGWTPGVNLGAIAISFRSDVFWTRMLPFSVASFAAMLLFYYLCLLLFSITLSRGGESDPCQRFVKVQLGPLHSWPKWLKASVPLVVAVPLWLAAGPVLTKLGVVPPVQSFAHRLEQALVLGAGIYLLWKYVVGAVLALHLLNTYVYLGPHPVWNFTNKVAASLLRPLKPLPLHFKKVDFAPVVGIALVFVLAELAEHGLTLLYVRLPL